VNVTIEFSGLAKILSGRNNLDITLPEGATYRSIVKELAKRYPGFINILIAPDLENFLSSTMLVINGDLVNPVMILDQSPSDGENLHLMSVITGG